jgi:hypothetical protein
MGLMQKKDLHSRSEIVWNPQPHVRLTQLKKKKKLTNKLLVVEDFFQDVDPVEVKSLHHVEVVVQQISQWKDNIQPLVYQSSEGMGQMNHKNIC